MRNSTHTHTHVFLLMERNLLLGRISPSRNLLCFLLVKELDMRLHVCMAARVTEVGNDPDDSITLTDVQLFLVCERFQVSSVNERPHISFLIKDRKLLNAS